MAKVMLQDGDMGERPPPVHYVMVVDNDPESAQQTKSILEKHGFEVKVFKDGGQVHGGVAVASNGCRRWGGARFCPTFPFAGSR